MKAYEALILYRNILVTLTRNGIGPEDVMYIDMVNDYRRMIAEGQKEADIWLILVDKYKLSASAIKKAVKRLSQEYTFTD